MLSGFFSDVLDDTFESGLQVLKPLAAQKLASEHITLQSPSQSQAFQSYSFAALPVAQSQATATPVSDKWPDVGIVAMFLFLILFLRN